MSFAITNRYTGAVLYTSATADDIAGAVIEAVKNHANLEGTNLEGANLRGANLEDANLEGANLEDANLEGANLRGTNLEDANLEGANLRGANLEGTNLEGANLRGTNLEDANLEGTNLEDANLEGTNLRGANLEGANGLKHPILQIAGSRHWIVVISRDEVCVGCHRRPMAEWLKKYKAVGRAEAYTPAQIAEYGAHLEYADRWLSAIEAALPKEPAT